MSEYNQLYTEAGQKYGVDPQLLMAQGKIESNFDPNAVSSAGAQGIAQIMPATAKSLGVDPTDPAQAIDGQARLMAENIKRYGNPVTALAAYHGGTDPSNWGPKTKNYVGKVMGTYQTADNDDANFDAAQKAIAASQSGTPSTANDNDDANFDIAAKQLASAKTTTGPSAASDAKPSYGEDLAKTAIGSTLPRGVAGAAMWAPNLVNLAAHGGEYLTTKAYNALTGSNEPVQYQNPLYSSEDVLQGGAKMLGIPGPYNSQYPVNKALDTAGQFIIGGKALGGANAPSALQLGAAGLGSSAASQAAPNSQLAPIAGALLGGGATAIGEGAVKTIATNPKQIIAANDAARADALNDIQGSPQDIQTAVTQRDAITQPIKEAAFANKQPVDATPIMSQIDDILNGPSGKRPSVVNAMNQVKDLITTKDPKTGEINGTVSDPEMLYESVKKGIGDMLDKNNPNNAANLNAMRQLVTIQKSLDGIIEKGAPGYKDYNEAYSQLSQPINEMKALQESNLLKPDNTINLNKLDNVIKSAQVAKTYGKGLAPEGSFSDNTMQTLQKLRDDLVNQKAVKSGVNINPGGITGEVAADMAATHWPAIGLPIRAGLQGWRLLRKNQLNASLTSSFRPEAARPPLSQIYMNHLMGLVPGAAETHQSGQ